MPVCHRACNPGLGQIKRPALPNSKAWRQSNLDGTTLGKPPAAKKVNAAATPLIRSRRQATGLLLAMGGVFVLARWLETSHPLLGFVRAFAEAALVGGLADWFAVTALFRHPLGLPIPHTAILPNNRDRLADSVADFLRYNFLTRRILIAEIARHDLAALAAGWLAEPARRRWLAERVAAGLSKELRLGPLLSDWLAVLMAQQKHQKLFDSAIERALALLDEHHADIYQKVSEKSPRWMPRRLNDEFYRRLMEGVAELLIHMLAPDSSARIQLEQALHAQIRRLKAGDYDALLRHQLDVAMGDGVLAARVEAELAGLAVRLAADPEWRSRLNRWLQRQAVLLLMRQREQVVGLVRRVIRDWDPQTVAERIETHVGRDLQFIRINGTLVGGLVGVLLHSLSLLFFAR